jgi:ribosomal protein L7Ae-like RNA K-turn-binding protein
MNEKLLHLLGIARKAGRLTLGTDAAKESLQKRKTVLVLLASDLSKRTAADVNEAALQAGVPSRSIPPDLDDLGAALGKRAGVVAVNDTGFAKKLLALIAEIEEESEQ